MKKYRYITIRCVDNELFEGKPVYRIFNNRDKGQIGIISWYRPWKEYVFSSRPECVFNNTCLTDIINFINIELPKLINS